MGSPPPMQTKDTTALELRRDASVVVPATITIPESLDDAAFILAGLHGLLTATHWARAAIVYAFTINPQKGGQVTDEAFAAREIHGLTKTDTIRKYRRAWLKAMEKGWADEARAGESVDLPVVPFSESQPHVSHNSGENEWYTPTEYIEAARWVLGAIDLDPASSEVANEVVQAERFYDLDDDGLAQEWKGRVWLNPPYAAEFVGRFAEKLVSHVDAKDVPAAVVLVNNATETAWFGQFVSRAAALCFPDGRVKFWSPDGTVGAPLQGQAVLYFGSDVDAFVEAFQPFGWVCLVWRPEA